MRSRLAVQRHLLETLWTRSECVELVRTEKLGKTTEVLRQRFIHVTIQCNVSKLFFENRPCIQGFCKKTCLVVIGPSLLIAVNPFQLSGPHPTGSVHNWSPSCSLNSALSTQHSALQCYYHTLTLSQELTNIAPMIILQYSDLLSKALGIPCCLEHKANVAGFFREKKHVFAKLFWNDELVFCYPTLMT